MAQDQDSFRTAVLGWLGGTLAGWGTVLLGLGGLLGGLLSSGGVLPGVAWFALLGFPVSLAIIAWRWLESMTSRFDLGPDRLVIRRGIFVKSIDEIELYRIKDVRLDFTLINQLTGIGTISIDSSDETTRAAPLVLHDVPRAHDRRERLRTLVDAARLKRRVREIDVASEV